MKASCLLLGFFLAAVPLFGAQGPTVQTKGEFLKILEGDKRIGAPSDRDAPEVLYIRRADIVRVAVVFSPRSADYRVLMVTASPAFEALGENEFREVRGYRTYIYTFGSLAAATEFSEAVVTAEKS